MRKYEFTNETKKVGGCVLHRIVAIKEFQTSIGIIKKGTVGGYIESEENLCHDDGSWVSGNARVSGNAQVYGKAWVYGNARVYGNAWVSGNARVSGNAQVSGDAQVYGNAQVSGDAQVCGNAQISGNAFITSLDNISTISGFGSENRTITFYLSKDNEILVSCGYFHVTLKQFRDKVKITHGDSKMAKEYIMIADLMEMRFNRVLEK